MLFEESDVSGEISSASWTRVRGKVTVAVGSEPGPRYFRLITPRGASNLLLFRVTRWPVVLEVDAGGDPERANRVPVPSLISGHLTADMIGRVPWGEEADLYRFHAKAGQRVKFSLLGARDWLSSDLSLTVMHADGRQVVFDEGLLIWDPYIDQTFKEEDDYIAAVTVTRTLTAQISRFDTTYYELAIGNAPQIWNVFPSGARRGQEVEAEFRADFVPRQQQLMFQSHGLEGGLRETQESGVYKLKLRSTPDASLGLHHIYLADDSGTLAPASFILGDLPEKIETEPNDTRDQAEPLVWPITVNGRMNHKGDQDWYRIEAKAGQRLVFEINGENFGGSRLDATLTLLDAKGKVLQFVDDQARAGRGAVRDPKIEHRFKQDGSYYLKVESVFRRWGVDQIYRLTVRPPHPDFIVSMRTDRPTAVRGGKGKLTVSVIRAEGFDCEVSVSAKGLPPGVAAKPVTIPAGSNEGTIELKVDPDAALVTTPIEVVGTARIGSAEEEHLVVLPGNPRLGTGPGYVDYRPQKVQLAVVEQAQFSLESILSTVFLVRGGLADVGVKVNRRAGFDPPLRFSLENLPAGVTLEESEVVDQGKQVRLRLRASESASPSRISNLVIAAEADWRGRTDSESAPKISLQLD